MKIHQLLDNIAVPLTNEEDHFINEHGSVISVDSLHDRDEVLAHNLVRKGVYDISKDNHNLIKKGYESDYRKLSR